MDSVQPVRCRPARQIFRIIVVVLALAAGLGMFAPAGSVSAAPDGQAGGPRFAPGPCSFPETTNLAQRLDLQCGTLTVPEEHANPSGPTIQLSVAIIKSRAANPDPVPVVFLQGGPGGSTIDAYLQLIPLDPRLNDLNRDIILFDQRGTLYAKPSLFCEETYQEGIDVLNLDLPRQEVDRRYMDALQRCHDRLVKEGVNLSAFDSLENAADVDDLRQALGYEKVHLYGVSYGTLLALHVLREFPQGLASVTIDSVVPPQVSAIADQPRVINHGLENIFTECAKDAECNRAYPNLKEVFYAQVDRLNAKKETVQITDYHSGTTYPMLLDGDSILSVIIQMLYSTDLVPLVPRTIYQIRAGDYAVVQSILANIVFDRTMSYGMFYSVWCAEEANFDPAKVNLEGLPPQLYNEEKDSVEQFVQTCAFWKVQPLDASAEQAVQSDVPTLVLAGAFDPVTPPEYAQKAAESLNNHYLFVFPMGGHAAVTSGECQDTIFLEFLSNPRQKPDDACITGQQVRFSTPGALVIFPKAINLLNPQGSELALLGIYGVGVLILLSAALVYPVAWLVRLLSGPKTAAVAVPSMDAAGEAVPAPRKKPLLYRLGPWLAVLTGGMLLAFILVLYGVTLQMVLSNDNRVLFGLPGSARPLFFLPVLAVIFGALMLAGAAAGWKSRAGSAAGKVYFSLLALAAAACVVVLFALGAVQAFFRG